MILSLFSAASLSRRSSSAAANVIPLFSQWRGGNPFLGSAVASPCRSSFTLSTAVSVSDANASLLEELPPICAANPTILQPRVLVYDGVCHLCHGGVKWIIRKDKHKKIKFCRLQSITAEPYLRLCGLDREDVLRRVLFVEGQGSYYEGSSAMLKVASYLSFPYSALSALGVVPSPIRDYAYDFLAKNRYRWFGRDSQCIIVQEEGMLERFIDRDEMFGGGHCSGDP